MIRDEAQKAIRRFTRSIVLVKRARPSDLVRALSCDLVVETLELTILNWRQVNASHRLKRTPFPLTTSDPTPSEREDLIRRLEKSMLFVEGQIAATVRPRGTHWKLRARWLTIQDEVLKRIERERDWLRILSRTESGFYKHAASG